MATRDSDLLRPSFIAILAGFVLSLLGAGVMVLAALSMGGTDAGRVLIVVLGLGLVLSEYIVTYVFAGMTVYLVYGLVAEGDGRMDRAWQAVGRSFWHLVSLALASTLVRLMESLLGGRNRRGGVPGGILASVLDAVGTTATYLVLPAMIIEDLDLGRALRRATFIVKNNLLLVAVTEIGVGTVVGVASFVAIALSILLGGGTFYLVETALGSSTAALLFGGALGVTVTGVGIAIVAVLSPYVTTAYHTCLFLWAREVERARTAGRDERSVMAPALVAAVLSS
jgi:hypothetical protein